MRRKSADRLRCLFLSLLIFCGGIGTAAANDDGVADFYRGKQLTWILSAGAGGGFGNYARAFAPYFTNHIPGHPTIIVENMTGAGGLRAMVYLYAHAPKDGTTIGLVHSSVPFAPLFGVKGAAFDPREMSWLGSISAEMANCVAWAGSPIHSWQDMLDKEFIVGSTGAGSQQATMPIMLNALFGTKMKVISGYNAGNDVYLAMERGEVMGRCSGGQISSLESSHPDWLTSGRALLPIQVSLHRNKAFPDTPAVIEFAKDERTRQLLQLMFAPQDMDRPLVVPPGVPTARIAALREAFSATMKDPEFLALAAKGHLEVEEVSGERVQKIIADAFSLPAEVVNAAKETMSLSGLSLANQ